MSYYNRGGNSKFNSFGTKTASIQLKGNSDPMGKTTPKRSRLTSPGKSGNLGFSKSQSQKAPKTNVKNSQTLNDGNEDNNGNIGESISISVSQPQEFNPRHSQMSQQSVARTDISLQGAQKLQRKTSQDKKFGKSQSQQSARIGSGLQESNESPSKQLTAQNSMIYENPTNYYDNPSYNQPPENDKYSSPAKKSINPKNILKKGAGGSMQQIVEDPAKKYLSKESMMATNEVGGDFFQASGKQTNVKTFVRFRPVNKMEQDLTEQGIGSQNVTYPNDKTVKTLNDNNTYTFDRIYKPDSTQAQLYKEVFSEILDDAMKGYNGTLFAYGPTGSGKTFTMFGPEFSDFSDKISKGVIPRVADNLFEKISKENQDLTFTVTVSMLEIYREQLSDLMDSDANDLKIKETPKRGVYVCGLSRHEIGTTKELLEMIQEGYGQKQTRSTKMNEYSSRSHTIVQIDIAIKHSTGAEKAGRLNLIDLAGSEKVWKSGAEGESLEEAKKINLSLSCLGNVINALTTKSSHIPYRDSKLTRILQESLGGNYKTSIIVACSPHSSMAEETTMALRFATRAKMIKLTYNMNIKQSQDTLRMVIDQLKAELSNVNGELNSYKIILERTRKALANNPIQNKEGIRLLDEVMVSIQQQIALPQDSQNNLDEEEQLALQFLAHGNTNQMTNIETRQLREHIEEKNEKIEDLELIILENKKKLLDLQQKLTDMQEEKNAIEVKYSKEKSENQYKEFKIDILNKQLQALVQKVCKNEQDFAQLLKERKELTETKIEDYLKNELKFQEIKLSDYFKNSCNFNFEIEFQKLEEVQKNMRALALQECDQNMLKTFAEDIQDLNKTFVMQTQVPSDINQSFIGNLDFGSTLNTNKQGLLKTIEFPNQLEQMSSKHMSKDLQLILLKQQVINSHIINQHLVRTINALEWKQVIEYGKYKMNSNLNAILSSHVQILENLLKSSQDTHKKLRKRFDEIEFEHNQVRNQLLHTHHPQGSNLNTKGSRIGQTAAKRRQSMRQNTKMVKQMTQQIQQIQLEQFKDYSWVEEVKKIVEESEKNMHHQLIYNPQGLQKAQEDIRHQTDLLKKIWEDSNVKELPNKTEQKIPDHDQMYVEEVKEKERLQSKILSLDQELKSLRAASNQYKKAYVEEKKKGLNTKKLMEELEIALRNNLREENETWQSTIKAVREQYDREIMLRQIESTKMQEKFQGIAYHALNSVQKLKQKPQIEKKDVESIVNEMVRLTEFLNNTTSQFNDKNESKSSGSKQKSSSGAKKDPKQNRLY